MGLWVEVWYLVFGVWCLVFGVGTWCMVFGVWGLRCGGVWFWVFKIWCLAFGIWCCIDRGVGPDLMVEGDEVSDLATVRDSPRCHLHLEPRQVPCSEFRVSG